MQNPSYPYPTTDVEALLEERAGYEARGLKDRVAQVDAQLAEMGVAVDPGVPDEYPAKGTADEVEAWVTVDPDMIAERTAFALEREVERGDKQRSRLTAKLEALAEASA